jgi:MFS family permease
MTSFDRRIGVVVAGGLIGVASRMSVATFLSIYFVREAGLGVALVGAAILVEHAVRGLLAPLFGALSDRIGRRPILICAVVATGFIMPSFLWVAGPVSLLTWSVAMGIAGAAQFPVGGALLIDLAPPERRQTVLALHYSAVCLGYTVGVAPAGFLAERGYELLAAGSAAGFAAVALLYLVGLRGPLPREAASAAGSLLAASLSAARDRWFLALAALGCMFPLGIGLTAFVSALFAADLGLDKGTIGLALSANGVIIAVLAVPVAARIEPAGPYRVLALASVFVAGGYLCFAGISHPGWALLAGTAVFTLGEVIFSSALPAAVARLAPAGYRGAYQGAWSMVSSLGVGAALFVSGLLRDRVGWDATWVAFAALSVALGLGIFALRGRFAQVERARAG